jgi:hypothetical protein
MKESKYKGQIARCEVESMVAPLRDKEPSPAWKKQFKAVLAHYDVPSTLLSKLAVARGSSNVLGHKYSKYTLNNMINNFIMRKGATSWTKNAQAVVNDHLDILVDYLSQKDDELVYIKVPENHIVIDTDIPEPEEQHPSLLERLEKERAEGKWPTVGAPKSEPIAKVNEVVDVPGGLEFKGQLLKPIDEVIPGYSGLGKSDGVKVKLRKIRKHKKRKITINIYI